MGWIRTGSGQTWKRPICWVWDHDWSGWFFVRPVVGARNLYRRKCRRCGETAHKKATVGL